MKRKHQTLRSILAEIISQALLDDIYFPARLSNSKAKLDSIGYEQASLLSYIYKHLELARDARFGDYACTLGMDSSFRALYAQWNPSYRPPKEFAASLCNIIRKKRSLKSILANVCVDGPGFINFTIKDDFLVHFLTTYQAASATKDYKAFCLDQKQRQNVIFEFVSANPTGPLNVVSSRAAALGAACCNLLEFVGHKVHREYFVNDYGNQISLLGYSAFVRYLESLGIDIPFPNQGYQGDYVKQELEALFADSFPPLDSGKLSHIRAEIETHSSKWVHSLNLDIDFDAEDLVLKDPGELCRSTLLCDTELLAYCESLGRALAERITAQQKQTLSRFGIDFHTFFHESILHHRPEPHKRAQAKPPRSELKQTFHQLASHCYTIENTDSASTVFFRSTAYGDDKDRVLLRADGRPTYFLSDIAYHANKMKRGFDAIYNIWGPDHHGYIPRLKAALQCLGYEGVFRVFIAQQLNLLHAGESVKMSKRSGFSLSLDQLMEELPKDVLRYFFVTRSFSSPMDFDLQEAKDRSEKNPYYYIVYSHARICSIFRKCTEAWDRESNSFLSENVNPNPYIFDWEWTPERRRLLFDLSRFTEEVQGAAADVAPHRLAQYLYRLAGSFSQFYIQKENRVLSHLDTKVELANMLLALLAGVQFALRTGLEILGVDAPERLEPPSPPSSD